MNQWIVTDFMEILNIRKLMAAAVVLVLCAATQSLGVNAYLKQTSPLPLRFSGISLANASFAPPQPLFKGRTPTNTTQIDSATTTPVETNAVAAQQQSPSVPPSNPVIYPPADPQNSTTATLPA